MQKKRAMDKSVNCAIITILVLIICFYLYCQQEYFGGAGPNVNLGHVYLYDNFNPEKAYRSYKFEPYGSLNEYKNGRTEYLKVIVKIPLKYIDISLPLVEPGSGFTKKQADRLNESRKIQIIGMYHNVQTASSLAEGVHHSAYVEPEWAYRANDPKYTHIITIRPGESYSAPPQVLGFNKVMILATI